MPKFALLVRSNPTAESGAPPTTAMLEEMLTYNKSLSDAGIMLAGEGFLSSSKGARITYDTSGNSTVTAGPFPPETLVAGFWIIKADGLDEAVALARKAPFREDGAQVEVRQIAGADDFGDQMTEELKAKEEELRKELEARVKAEAGGK